MSNPVNSARPAQATLQAAQETIKKAALKAAEKAELINSDNIGEIRKMQTEASMLPYESMAPILGEENLDLFPDAPKFRVPANPLLPSDYQEVLDYESMQYANGFYRTQIGRYVMVQQLINSNTLDNRFGYLVGVGINYLLLQDDADNIMMIDIYSVKFTYVFYNITPLPPQNLGL